MKDENWRAVNTIVSHVKQTSTTTTTRLTLSFEVTQLAAAQAKGLPPKVLAWFPGSKTSARSLQSIAPIGTPPPSA